MSQTIHKITRVILKRGGFIKKNGCAIIIQKIFRGFMIRKYILIPSSCYQTKIWRKNRKWYKGGKMNECEIYQINLIQNIIKSLLLKTHERIIDNKIIENNKPLCCKNGFEWTENFDGKLIKNEKIYYFNLKFVCDAGGSQTRTLREVYHFIKAQYDYLLNNNHIKNTYFINILDGNECYKKMFLIKNINENKIYKELCKFVFIGDLNEFQNCAFN